MSALSVEQRLATIEAAGVVGWRLVWDGCHKIYILTKHDDEAEVAERGFDLTDDVFPADQIRDLWDRSCGLRFVRMWDLDVSDTPWDIAQGEFDEVPWAPTHRSISDGSEAMVVTDVITLMNENGDQWTDAARDWEPIEKGQADA